MSRRTQRRLKVLKAFRRRAPHHRYGPWRIAGLTVSMGILLAIPLAYAVSFYFSVSTIIYQLVRRATDSADLNEFFDDTPLTPESSRTPAPPDTPDTPDTPVPPAENGAKSPADDPDAV